jgi:hypothetical protein
MISKKLIVGFLTFVFVFMTAIQSPTTASAEEGKQKFTVSVDNVAHFAYTDSGVFNTPTGSGGPGPLLPGQRYEWRFNAHPGERLSFATMFVQSNDWFFAPDEMGIPLFNAGGSQASGDVTHYVKLWDAGTEGDQVPGEGADQAPRQSGADSGPADPTDQVRQVLTAGLPPVNELVRVTIDALGNGRFALRISNISGSSSFPTPLAPGVGVVHSAPAPLFINGAADWGLGLEALAEDGDPSSLSAVLQTRTGVNTPIAPIAWAVHQSANPLFAVGHRASAGLESLAEDGSPAALVASLGDSNSGAAVVGRGSSGPGPIFGPQGNYSFEIMAAPGDDLSLAFMFVQSNDWFYGVNRLPLFDAAGDPRSGDLTHYVTLYDAGTEVDQTPGFGSNQAPRQAGPNTGPGQGGVVSTANFAHSSGVVHVTVTAVE